MSYEIKVFVEEVLFEFRRHTDEVHASWLSREEAPGDTSRCKCDTKSFIASITVSRAWEYCAAAIVIAKGSAKHTEYDFSLPPMDSHGPLKIWAMPRGAGRLNCFKPLQASDTLASGDKRTESQNTTPAIEKEGNQW